MIIATLLMLVGATAQAQTSPALDLKPLAETEYGLQVGNLLPNQIRGISEILPFWGATYATQMWGAMMELHGLHSRAYDSRYTIVSATYRIDANLDRFTAFGGAGLDGHYYSTPDRKEEILVGGFHVGTGIMTLVTKGMWFRTEMRFHFEPGTGLYFGFGLVLRSLGGGGEGGDGG